MMHREHVDQVTTVFYAQIVRMVIQELEISNVVIVQILPGIF